MKHTLSRSRCCVVTQSSAPRDSRGEALRDETKTAACERLDETLTLVFDMLQNASDRTTQVVSTEIELQKMCSKSSHFMTVESWRPVNGVLPGFF